MEENVIAARNTDTLPDYLKKAGVPFVEELMRMMRSNIFAVCPEKGQKVHREVAEAGVQNLAVVIQNDQRTSELRDILLQIEIFPADLPESLMQRYRLVKCVPDALGAGCDEEGIYIEFTGNRMGDHITDHFPGAFRHNGFENTGDLGFAADGVDACFNLQKIA